MPRRAIKTVILGVVALCALCWSLYSHWDIPREDIAAVVLGGFIVCFGLALLALLIVGLLHLLRRFRRPRSSYLIDDD